MKHIVSRMSSYFPNRWPLSYLNLTKNMKTYIRRQQHKKLFIHQDIKQKEPPQKYRLGTISNISEAIKSWFLLKRSHKGDSDYIIPIIDEHYEFLTYFCEKNCLNVLLNVRSNQLHG